MQTTLAYAPEPGDFDDEFFFDAPVLTFTPPEPDDEESEQGEP